jgi:Fe-S-cluster containining protein
MEELQKLLDLARQKKSENQKFLQRLKARKPGNLDEITHQLHDEAFQHIDCLDCANCCKSLGPRIVQKDINRISKFLNLKPAEFIEKYLRLDEDGDYVFKSMPCPFLATDHYCMIYKVRPKACATYPHTDQRKIHQILDLVWKNTLTCPAVAEIVEKMKVPYIKK